MINLEFEDLYQEAIRYFPDVKKGVIRIEQIKKDQLLFFKDDSSIILYDGYNKSIRFGYSYADLISRVYPCYTNKEKWLYEFSIRLMDIINRYGWSLDDLSDETNISKRTIYNYVRGETVPNIYNLIVICSVIGINKNEFEDLIGYLY